MRFDLVDGRRNLVIQHQVDQPVGVKIADAYSTDPFVPIKALHVPPGSVYVAVRLMDQIKIQVIMLQFSKGCLERRLGPAVAGVFQPQLCGNEYSSRATPLRLMALPTASSLSYDAAVSISR